MSKTLTESLGKFSRISQFFSLIMCNCIWQSGFEEIIKLSVVWCCTYYLRPIASIFKNNPTLKTQRTRGLGIYAFLKVLVSKFLLLNISNNRRVWEKNNWYPFTHNPHLLFFKRNATILNEPCTPTKVTCTRGPSGEARYGSRHWRPDKT